MPLWVMIFKRAKEVLEVYNLDKEDLAEVFVRACQYGDITAARWANDHFDLTDADSIDRALWRALWGACRYGKLDVVKWLCGNDFDIKAGVKTDDLILELCKIKRLKNSRIFS